MTFSSYIPVALVHQGKKFKGFIFYCSDDVTGYKADLVDLMEDIVKFFKCEDNVEVQKILMNALIEVLTRVTKFWLEEVFQPLSGTETIPAHSRCYCYNRTRYFNTCLHDLITFSHYEEDGVKLKVDVFAGPPSVSINVAALDRDDTAKFRAYYANLLRLYAQMSCCRCCPLSMDLMSDLKQLIIATKQTLSDIDDYKLPSVNV